MSDAPLGPTDDEIVDDDRQENLGRSARNEHWWLRENWYRDIWLFILTGCLVTFALVSGSNNSDRIDDVEKLTDDIGKVTMQIQQSRFDVTYLSCLEQNDRSVSAKVKAQARADELIGPNNDVVKSLIRVLVSSLAPYRKDCEQWARDRVSPPPPDERPFQADPSVSPSPSP